ncbi:hypothetical protein ACIBL8_21720 [Streptomyces sp. NPDC050523]|uniref:hypothetical protein n=1 Tax=Streptomyces sp. NPDC050523 TaxID=3365622 RepID=UPI0037A37FB8
MTWSLGYLPPREPMLLDALHLSLGRSLYLANAFEMKCRYVLRIINLVAAVGADPVADLQQAIATLPNDKLLGPTLQDLNGHMPSSAETADLLHAAKKARNFIAHEGAGAGYVSDLSREHIIKNASRLRTAVADLARGDNIVSTWCHGIEEPREPAPKHLIDAYPQMIDAWVFGPFGSLLDSAPARS